MNAHFELSLYKKSTKTDLTDSKNLDILRFMSDLYTLNKEIILNYLSANKPLIDPYDTKFDKPHINLNGESRVYIAVSDESYLSQSECSRLKLEFLDLFIPMSPYVDKIPIQENAPYFILELFITDELVKIAKWCIKGVYSLGERWALKWERETVHTLFYDSLDIIFYKKGHAHPVRLGFDGIGGLGLHESLFKGLPLFYQVDDFERDKNQELASTITYGDLLRAQRDGLSRKELLQKHLKKSICLDGVVNFNKFSVTESYMLIKIMTELDEKTFLNFVTWYREKGRYYPLECRHEFKLQRLTLITMFILETIGDLNIDTNHDSDDIQFNISEHYHTARDYVEMCRGRRRKVKIDFSSGRALTERHDQLYASIKNKLYKDSDYMEDFVIHKEYKPLVKALRKRGSGYKYLSKPVHLVQEGNKMGHCVGGYVWKVKNGRCIIASTMIDGVHYTLEIAAVIKEHELEGYSLEQMQSRFNSGIKDPSHRIQVIDFLNNINTRNL